jgi:hypothetical protein
MVENPLVPDRVQNADLNAAYYFVACRQGITPKSTSAFNLHNDHYMLPLGIMGVYSPQSPSALSEVWKLKSRVELQVQRVKSC